MKDFFSGDREDWENIIFLLCSAKIRMTVLFLSHVSVHKQNYLTIDVNKSLKTRFQMNRHVYIPCIVLMYRPPLGQSSIHVFLAVNVDILLPPFIVCLVRSIYKACSFSWGTDSASLNKGPQWGGQLLRDLEF